MSWTEEEQEIILNHFGCSYCGAEPGAWCVTKSDRKATWLHANRSRKLNHYSWQVYEEGEKAGRFFAERKAQRVIDHQLVEINNLKRKVAQLEQFQMAWVGGV